MLSDLRMCNLFHVMLHFKSCNWLLEFWMVGLLKQHPNLGFFSHWLLLIFENKEHLVQLLKELVDVSFYLVGASEVLLHFFSMDYSPRNAPSPQKVILEMFIALSLSSCFFCAGSIYCYIMRLGWQMSS